jgi:hypothetical protein
MFKNFEKSYKKSKTGTMETGQTSLKYQQHRIVAQKEKTVCVVVYFI